MSKKEVHARNELRTEAEMAYKNGKINQAIRLYQRLLDDEHANYNVSDAINLGALLRQQGHLLAAASHYRKWIKRLPRNNTLVLNCCNCLRDLGQPAEALQMIVESLREHKQDADLLTAQAECLLDLGQLEESRRQLETVLSQHKRHQKAWATLGVVLAKQQQLQQAIAAFSEAEKCGADIGQMSANKINLLKDLGQLDAADRVWESLDESHKSQLHVQGAFAGLALAKNEPEKASNIFANLARRMPLDPCYWLNWTASLRLLKYTVAPQVILKRGLRYCPGNKELLEALAQLFSEMGNNDATRRIWGLTGREGRIALKDINVFNRQFIGLSDSKLQPEERSKQAREWERQKTSSVVNNLWKDYLLEPMEGRRVRVGYLTADACNHPVARFLLPILHNHNTEKVEIWMLSCGPYEDWITAQLKAASEHWVDLQSLSDQQAARIIADLRLDVIVELGGFSANSKIGALAFRPAPVQLSYLGYPGPTYLDCIDAWIGDKILFGKLGQVDRQAHRLINIQHGYMAFDPGGHIDIPERTEHRAFRFGCFNHARKLSDEAIKLFVKVLDTVADSELVLKSISFHEEAERERIKRRFVAAGLEEKRIVLLNWVEGGLNHLMLYREIDVALDPIPYGGATTTCEALWMGVPVVTLYGRGMIGALSASILYGCGHKEWVATDEVDYCRIAASLANKGPRSRKERFKLRQRVKKSALADASRLAKELEKLYLEERDRVEGC